MKITDLPSVQLILTQLRGSLEEAEDSKFKPNSLALKKERIKQGEMFLTEITPALEKDIEMFLQSYFIG